MLQFLFIAFLLLLQTEEPDLVQNDDDEAKDILIIVRQGKEEAFDPLSQPCGNEDVTEIVSTITKVVYQLYDLKQSNDTTVTLKEKRLFVDEP